MSLRCLSRVGIPSASSNGGPIAPSAFCGFSGSVYTLFLLWSVTNLLDI